jgi:hypothetical protein
MLLILVTSTILVPVPASADGEDEDDAWIRFHNHGLNTEETPVIPDYYPNMEIQV